MVEEKFSTYRSAKSTVFPWSQAVLMHDNIFNNNYSPKMAEGEVNIVE